MADEHQGNARMAAERRSRSRDRVERESVGWSGPRPEKERAKDSMAEAPAVPADRKMVLVVDDDDDTREAMQDLLRQKGYSVLTAANGEQALALLGRTRPRLIFTDLCMPVMNGWALCRELLCDPVLNRIPVIVITATPGERAADLGAARVLRKPVHYEQIFESLHQLAAEPG